MYSQQVQTTPPDSGNVARSSGDSNFEYIDDATEVEGVEIEEYLKAARRPVKVTRRNKCIGALSFSVLILFMVGYTIALMYFHICYPEIVNNKHLLTPTIIMYCVMGSDIICSFVGIWTCLRKTGPQPMIFACGWLLLTSLIAACATISLLFETKSFRLFRKDVCRVSKMCETLRDVTICLWCALITLALKVICMILLRLNYPQVFNWMVGKDVYVDEDVFPEKRVTHRHLGGGFFDAPDIARIAARGSLVDTEVIETTQDGNAIFVARKSVATTDLNAKDSGQQRVAIQRLSRVSAFVNL